MTAAFRRRWLDRGAGSRPRSAPRPVVGPGRAGLACGAGGANALPASGAVASRGTEGVAAGAGVPAAGRTAAGTDDAGSADAAAPAPPSARLGRRDASYSIVEP